MQNYIKTISEKNPEINAFIEVYSKEALSTASQIDKKISNGTAGKLAGMVVGIKDNICFKNHKISASSKMLKDFKIVEFENLKILGSTALKVFKLFNFSLKKSSRAIG